MASPPRERLLIAPTPNSRGPRTPVNDDALWRRLRDAGLDEESIKRRDKATLIAYVAKLEAEIFDLQHHMGLLLLEKKDWASKYEEMKVSVESSERMHKHEQAALTSAMAEARKREESLQKALSVEKECVLSIENTLHDLRAEAAETKVAAENKLTEARVMVEDAQKKFTEAEAKLREAESLQAEATRCHRATERNLQELEAREDDLRRRIMSFNSDCEARDKEISFERHSLSERQKILQQGQERLLEEQTLLNQREEYLFSRSQEISCLEKELEASKASLEKEHTVLNERKASFDITVSSLSVREEAIIKKETLLDKKEQELLLLQEQLASRESNAVKQLIADQETELKLKQSEFETEMGKRCKMVEDEIENKRRAWELREVDLRDKEDFILEREHELEVKSRDLAVKEKDVVERFNVFEEKEKMLACAEKEIELQKIYQQKEKELLNNARLDLEKTFESLEDKRKQVDCAGESLEVMKRETNELMLFEMKLKEEIDVIRAEKLEIMVEADNLKAEKAKFEIEWESIDEKREELRQEAERIAEERQAISNFLKDERDVLKREKDSVQDQYKRDRDAIQCEREAFIIEMEHQRSEWFNKIQQEREDLLLDVEVRRTELENSIEMRRKEIESYLEDRERAFQQERKTELQNIDSLKETLAKDVKHVDNELKKLEHERIEIGQDRELRDKEWSDLNSAIEELKIQRKKLEVQRESLHAERENINAQIEHLEKVENFKMISDNITAPEIQQSNLGFSGRTVYAKRSVKPQTTKNIDANEGVVCIPSKPQTDVASDSLSSSPHFGWIKRCSNMIFKSSPDRASNGGRSLISTHENENLRTPGQLSGANGRTRKSISGGLWTGAALDEPKVILEVPSAAEEVKRVDNSDHFINTDASDSSNSFSEGPLAGKRRRIKNTSSHDWVDKDLQQEHLSKRRRQEEDSLHDLLEGTSALNDVNLTVLDHEAANSTNQMQGVALEDTVLVEKITNQSGVTCLNGQSNSAHENNLLP